MSMTTANLQAALQEWDRMHKRNHPYAVLLSPPTDTHSDLHWDRYVEPVPLHWWHTTDHMLKLLYISAIIILPVLFVAWATTQ